MKRKNQFYRQLLEKELWKMAWGEDAVIKKPDRRCVLADWKRNWEACYFDNKSVKELRNGKEFKDIKDLEGFIRVNLLQTIQDDNAKEYYVALMLSTFHQTGFPYASSFLNIHKLSTIGLCGQPAMKITFSSLDNGIQIKEVNTYGEIKNERAEKFPLPNGTSYHFQTTSTISLLLTKANTSTYQLAIKVQDVNVDVNSKQIKVLFSQNLYRRTINFFVSLINSIKSHLGLGVKLESNPILDKNWLSQVDVDGEIKEPDPTVAMQNGSEAKSGAKSTLSPSLKRSEKAKDLSLSRTNSLDSFFKPPVGANSQVSRQQSHVAKDSLSVQSSLAY